MLKKYSKNIILLMLLIYAGLPAFPQKNKPARVANMEVLVIENSKLRISYDILNSDSSRRHEVNLIFFSTDDNRALFPRTISGDIGVISGDGRKTIEWDITKDFNQMQEDFYPMLILDGRDRIGTSTGGWRNAALSLAVPGLGDYFVASAYDMKIKPWMRTLATYAFIGAGYYTQKTRVREEYIQLEYTHGSMYEGGPIVPMFVPKVYPGEVHYRFFKWDSEIFYTIGGAIWLADIFWVFNEGYINDKISKFYWGKDLKIIAANKQLGISIKF